MIKISNVSKSYKVVDGKSKLLFRKYKIIKALENINLEIKDGEIVGLLGLNGAGKTTLIKLMSGLISPDKDGCIKINGYNPNKKERDYLKSISLVSGQKNQLIWDLTAMDTFELNKSIYKISDERFQSVLQQLTKKLDIEDKVDVPIRKLSLGQKMKLEIISAMLHTPKILYLDEPTIGLDIITQTSLREFIKEYHRNTSATIILTSHNIADISVLCDRVIFLDRGHIIFDIKTSELENKLPILNYQMLTIKINEMRKINKEYIQELCKIVSYDQHELKLQVHKDNMVNITKYLFANLDINSISITDNDLNDVIKDIYGPENGEGEDK